MKNKPTKKEHKYLNQADKSTTRIAKYTGCCGGYHQTIAGALLKSKEWEEWYDYAGKNMLFDVAETHETDAMSDNHCKAFIEFIKQQAKKEAGDECIEVIEKLKFNSQFLEHAELRLGEELATILHDHNKRVDESIKKLNQK